MSKLVVHGAQLSCSKGTSPGSLSILPTVQMTGDDQNIATVDDYKPMVNIPTFGMCTTQANPQVAAATSAAQGVLTPQPCIPVTTSAWSPGASIVTVDGVKALTKDSTVSCQWSGSISISTAASDVEVE